MYQLVAECITGVREESYSNANMERGVELEGQARDMYSLIAGNEVRQVGFCMQDKGLYGCSADGLIGDDGGIEIKCPASHTHVEYLLGGKLPTTYVQQVQGCMFVTGRSWWDFVSYYPGLRLLRIRIERDEFFIKQLEIALNEFCDELETLTEKLKG